MKKLLKVNYFFLVMLVFNLVLAISVGIVFTQLIQENKNNIQERDKENLSIKISELARQFNATLVAQDAIIKQYAEYIEEENLTEEQTIQYLTHWIKFYAQVDIIDIETMKAISMNNEDYGNRLDRNYDLSHSDVVVRLCENYDQIIKRGPDIQMTEIFVLSTSNERAVSFYQPIIIEGRKKVLSIIETAKHLQESSSAVTGIESEKGLLIDQNGIILFGTIPGMNTETNYYEFVNSLVGEQETYEIWDMMHDYSKGHFEIKNDQNNEWTITFCKISTVNNWVYLYYESEEAFNVKDQQLSKSLIIICLMSIWLFADITGYYLYNRRLRKTLNIIDNQNKDLQAANQAKNIFISNMSHEIRTPINAVLGMDEMIIRETDDEQIRVYAHDIKNAGKVLLGIINDVLDYSKIESGKMEIINEEYDIGSVINDLYNIIALRVKEKQLVLKMNIDSEIPHLLYGDEIRIKQIILNILTNAVKYTEKGTITLSMKHTKVDAEKIILKVSVKDTGIGIKKEEMDKLFTAFERLDEKRNRSIEGTGLGMNIVMRLLEQMGSRLKVESEYSVGSTFSFDLEQKVMDSKPVGDINNIRNNRPADTEEQASVLRASKAKILAVDDNGVNLTVVKGLLKRTEAQIDTAESGQECLDLVAKNHYDIILLDHRMPQMDGVETLKKLKQMGDRIAAIPVIALTANVVSGAYEMYLREGFTDFLSKPINGNKLERMLAKYLPEKAIDSEEEIVGKIDWDSGIKACGTEELFHQVLHDYVDLYGKSSEELAKLFEEKDIENYTIKVHALKSSSRMAGASVLSLEAQQLEKYGDERDWDAIEKNHSKFMNHYEIVVSKMKSLLGKIDKKIEKIKISKDEFIEALNGIEEFNQQFDFDNIDYIMKTLENSEIPEEMVSHYKELKIAVHECNQQQISGIVKQVCN